MHVLKRQSKISIHIQDYVGGFSSATIQIFEVRSKLGPENFSQLLKVYCLSFMQSTIKVSFDVNFVTQINDLHVNTYYI